VSSIESRILKLQEGGGTKNVMGKQHGGCNLDR